MKAPLLLLPEEEKKTKKTESLPRGIVYRDDEAGEILVPRAAALVSRTLVILQ